MLELCWTSHPNDRPTVEDVLQRLEMVQNSSEPLSPGVDEENEGYDYYHILSSYSPPLPQRTPPLPARRRGDTSPVQVHMAPRGYRTPTSTQRRSRPLLAPGLEVPEASRRITTSVLRVMAVVLDPTTQAPGPHQSLTKGLPRGPRPQPERLHPRTQARELLRIKCIRRGSPFLPPMGRYPIP